MKMPVGPLSCEWMAGPPSPAKPAVVEPATMYALPAVIAPAVAAGTSQMTLLVLSEKNTLPLESTATLLTKPSLVVVASDPVAPKPQVGTFAIALSGSTIAGCTPAIVEMTPAE